MKSLKILMLFALAFSLSTNLSAGRRKKKKVNMDLDGYPVTQNHDLDEAMEWETITAVDLSSDVTALYGKYVNLEEAKAWELVPVPAFDPRYATPNEWLLLAHHFLFISYFLSENTDADPAQFQIANAVNALIAFSFAGIPYDPQYLEPISLALLRVSALYLDGLLDTGTPVEALRHNLMSIFDCLHPQHPIAQMANAHLSLLQPITEQAPIDCLRARFGSE